MRMHICVYTLYVVVDTCTQMCSFPLQDIPYIAVTSFIFLRFFVPAILSPKLFALRDYHADQRTERTLKLVAKVQQPLSPTVYRHLSHVRIIYTE